MRRSGSPAPLIVLRLWGPCQVRAQYSDQALRTESPQWPDEDLIPGFKTTVEEYFRQVQTLGYQSISLIAEAFGLGPDALDKFYDSDEVMRHRGKVCT